MKTNLKAIAIVHGTSARTSLTETVSFHKAYVAAEKDVQGEIRDEYMLGYIIGKAKLSEKATIIVMETPRAERTADEQKVYDCARASFRMHIVRPEPSVKAGQGDLVEAAMRIIGKMTAAQKRKLVKLMAE